ncbi:Conserved_hypothetical protein [Hexamita inflata]|uniref:Uncharacterized protein n=1 Tax=Hexamita inflata TaxID=28002 RepID=A0AA86UD95_9EUKA|nr:Conserved hypothetical protein [Hexamita inflata]
MKSANEHQLISTEFEIQVLKLKLEKQLRRYKEEEDVLRERLNMQQVKYSLQLKDEMNATLDEDTSYIAEKFAERVRGVLAEIQAREHWQIKSLEAQNQLEQIDPQMIQNVRRLKSEVTMLTEQIQQQLNTHSQLQQTLTNSKQELSRLKAEKREYAQSLLTTLKQKSTFTYTQPRALKMRSTSPTNYNYRPPVVSSILNSQNPQYTNLHAHCRQQIAEVRTVFNYVLSQNTKQQQNKRTLEENIRKIVVRNNFQLKMNGFLQFPDLSEEDSKRFMDLLAENDCLELIASICLLEDLDYNLGQEEKKGQRIGLNSQSRGLRKTYEAVYDV